MGRPVFLRVREGGEGQRFFAVPAVLLAWMAHRSGIRQNCGHGEPECWRMPLRTGNRAQAGLAVAAPAKQRKAWGEEGGDREGYHHRRFRGEEQPQALHPHDDNACVQSWWHALRPVSEGRGFGVWRPVADTKNERARPSLGEPGPFVACRARETRFRRDVARGLALGPASARGSSAPGTAHSGTANSVPPGSGSMGCRSWLREPGAGCAGSSPRRADAVDCTAAGRWHIPRCSNTAGSRFGSCLLPDKGVWFHPSCAREGLGMRGWVSGRMASWPGWVVLPRWVVPQWGQLGA
jgi:hypothetical protein